MSTPPDPADALVDAAASSAGDATTVGSPSVPDVASPTLGFGPYADRDLAFVAIVDPGYLLDLVREGVGPSDMRAEAARALALRGRLGPPDAASRAAAHSAVAWAVRAAGTARGAGVRRGHVTLGLAALLGAALLADRDGGAWDWGGGDAARPPDPTALSHAPVERPAIVREPVGRPRAEDDRSTTSGDGEATPSATAGPPPPCGARVPGAIPAESAGDHLDTFQAVEFEVVQAKDTGRVTFLNSRIPYAGAFYVAIFPDDYAAFPEPPATYLAGRCIVVQGTVETYRGAPQIVLRHPDDLRIVDLPAALGPGRAASPTARAAGPLDPAPPVRPTPRPGEGAPVDGT